MSDLRLVLDTVGSDRPVLVGMNEGGAANILFTATNPERVRSIVWVEPLPRVAWTPDFPWGVKPENVEHDQRALDLWGTNDYGAAWAKTEATERETLFPEGVRLAGVMSRHTATPDVARELARMSYETDVRGVLQSVQAPTLLLVREESRADVEAAEYVASLMPDAAVARVASFEPDELGPVIDAVRGFLGAEPPAPELDTILSTVLFTDIVGSTEKQASLGNRGWKDLVERHHQIVREHLAVFRGIEIDTAGDEFYATFDGPARAATCATAIVNAVKPLGIEVRAGLHAGEVATRAGKAGGLSVVIGSRVGAAAGSSEVLATQTVKDLTGGSGLVFEEAGEYELKGVPDRWRLYRVVS